MSDQSLRDNYSTVIIGGGAAGICAAIIKGRRGESVVVCERMPQLGKKILATGDGRCNLLNDELNEVHYNSAARELVKSVFRMFGKNEILNIFGVLGLEMYSKEGRIFPVTNQAATVLKVLEIELKRLSIPVELEFKCSDISFSGNNIIVSSESGKKVECQKVIITGGGKTYPAFGSDGSMYQIVSQMGHSIVKPVPSAVPLVIKDTLCHVLQGQKIFATVKSVIEGLEGEEVRGELLFTKYGLSGTCILDVSEEISIALNRNGKTDVFVSVDMVPFMSREQLNDELEWRRKNRWTADEMLVGILPNKICIALKDIFGPDYVNNAVDLLKDRRFKASGTRGWNEAEFTSGGVNVDEVNPNTLESKLKKGVYFAGEILDVNGKRGGYNLGWAWASGFVAGQTRQ